MNLWFWLKRLLQVIPLCIGANAITCLLFFGINSPDDIARIHVGQKYADSLTLTQWKQAHQLNDPLFYNKSQHGLTTLTHTLFFRQVFTILTGDLGLSLGGRDIASDIRARIGPSLALATPCLVFGLVISICATLGMLTCLGSTLERMALWGCLTLMSISTIFFILVGQFLFAHLAHWFPISGYAGGLEAWRFVLLPVGISLISQLGPNLRWYRQLFLGEQRRAYAQFARSKGLSEPKVLLTHVLRNSLMPVVTQVVASLPLLILGSLLLESFFGIPGLGSYTLDAIRAQDFMVVRAMVFLGTVLVCLGLILTDAIYPWVDPRCRLPGHGETP